MAIAKWQKIDFHTHTPASQCFSNKDISADDWIKSAIDAGLDGVVVTDHNSAEWVEDIRNAAIKMKENEGKTIAIYPGIELCVNTENTHILIVFDPKIDTTKVKEFLTKCGITNEFLGNTEKSVDLSTLEELVPKYDFLIIPAHFSKQKGLSRVNVNGIKQYDERLPIAAIEVRDQSCLQEVERKVHNKVLKKLPALVTGSDNPDNVGIGHSIDGFGKTYTWIKIGEHSLESLRMAFLESDRVQLEFNEGDNPSNPNLVTHSYISRMRIEKLKHVDELDFRFSPHLNCVVGGRGAGKSTIIEMIRLVLHEINENGSNSSKYPLISGVTTEESSIQIYYDFGSTSKYRVTAKGKKNREWVYKKASDEVLEEYPEFPAMIFSQKEIFNLVDDDENSDKAYRSPILEIVDDSIKEEKGLIEEQIALLQQKALDSSLEFRNLKEKLIRIPQIRSEIEIANGQMESFKNTGFMEKKRYMIL